MAGGQLEADLGDVAEPTSAGRLVDPELDRDVNGSEQRELLWLGLFVVLVVLVVFVVFVHAPMMRRGCDTSGTMIVSGCWLVA